MIGDLFWLLYLILYLIVVIAVPTISLIVLTINKEAKTFAKDRKNKKKNYMATYIALIVTGAVQLIAFYVNARLINRWLKLKNLWSVMITTIIQSVVIGGIALLAANLNNSFSNSTDPDIENIEIAIWSIIIVVVLSLICALIWTVREYNRRNREKLAAKTKTTAKK